MTEWLTHTLYCSCCSKNNAMALLIVQLQCSISFSKNGNIYFEVNYFSPPGELPVYSIIISGPTSKTAFHLVSRYSLLTKYNPFSTQMLPQVTCVCAKSFQLCPTLCNPMDCSLPGSCIHGILQARILERVAMPSSRRLSWPRDWILVSGISQIGRWILNHKRHLGGPK